MCKETAKLNSSKSDTNPTRGTKKQSLFAQRMAAKKTKEVPVQNQTDSTSTVRMEAKFIPEDNFPENDEKMAQMTEEEILEEQRRLIEKLDAITVQFLKTRRSGKGKSSGNLHREPERRSKCTENDHFMDFTSQEASELNVCLRKCLESEGPK